MQNIRLEHPTWALAAPGNPESATTLSPIYLIFGKHVFFLKYIGLGNAISTIVLSRQHISPPPPQ